MEATAAAATMVGSSFGMYRTSIPLGRLGFSATSRPYLFRFQTKQLSSLSFAKPEDRRVPSGIRRGFVVRASSSSSSSSSDPAGSIAPLRMESPIGQFLSQILVSHPHLVPAAVEQQLDQLQTDRDAEKQTEAQSSAGTHLVLYRRIAEVKANERRKALEEILYALVVQKFMDANVSLVPGVAPSSTDVSDRVDTWPIQDEKLEQLHSPEAYEMIQNHLALILGNRLGDSTSIAQISKLRVEQVYAASVMYGYFLRRVDQRFQLEKTVKILPNAINEKETNARQFMEQNTRRGIGEDSFRGVSSHPEAAMSGGFNPAGGVGSNIKPSRLRTYVMSFDGDTLKNYATIRSKEAVSIIEKHTEALFGRPEIVITPGGGVDSSNDDLIKISFGGLKRLVLEAVTFGSFLWDVESYVDSRYHFVVS